MTPKSLRSLDENIIKEIQSSDCPVEKIEKIFSHFILKISPSEYVSSVEKELNAYTFITISDERLGHASDWSLEVNVKKAMILRAHKLGAEVVVNLEPLISFAFNPRYDFFSKLVYYSGTAMIRK